MDNFFVNMFRKREAQQPIASTPGVPSSTNEQGPKVDGGSFEERIAYARTPDTALLVAAVYRAVNLRADTMGVMPVQYREKDFENGNFVVKTKGLQYLHFLLK